MRTCMISGGRRCRPNSPDLIDQLKQKLRELAVVAVNAEYGDPFRNIQIECYIVGVKSINERERETTVKPPIVSLITSHASSYFPFLFSLCFVWDYWCSHDWETWTGNTLISSLHLFKNEANVARSQRSRKWRDLTSTLTRRPCCSDSNKPIQQSTTLRMILYVTTSQDSQHG